MNIPKVKVPNTGPPTTPNIVRAACRTAPKYLAIKAIAKQQPPYSIDITFVHMAAVDSSKLCPLKCLTNG